MSQSTILQDLAVVVVTAATASLLAPRLRLPALPAYLLAGVALGRINAGSGRPLLGDLEAVSALSNLGVTFLMFAIGLEFDFRKARPIFVPALLANLAEFLVMFALGGATASMLGLSRAEGLFLGGLLGVSSTMVTLAALREKGHLDRNYGRLTIGVLVLEDVVAVILLVLLSGLGLKHGGGETAGAPATVWQTILYLGAFVTGLLTLGRLGSARWLPRLSLDEKPDLMAPLVGGMVMGVGLLAERFAFSPALGAFVIGAALAETKSAGRIGVVAEPFRDMFSAVFFVALGVSIDPVLLLESLPVVVPLTLLMVAGKALACWAGAFVGGQKAGTATRMALSKANIGEFSFVIAALGERAGVTGPRVTAVAAGVALLSIMLNRPFVHRSEAIVVWLGRHMPAQLRQASDFYGNLLTGLGSRLDGATFWRVMRGPLAKIALHLLFFLTIVVASHMACLYLRPQLEETLSLVRLPADYATSVVWLAAGPVTLPFVVAFAHQMEAALLLLSELAVGVGSVRARTLGFVARLLTILVMLALAMVFLAFAAPWLPGGLAPVALLVTLALLGWVFRGALRRAQSRFEVLFLESFNEAARQEEAGRRAAMLQGMVKRHKWPLHLREFKVSPHTRAAGRRIGELDLRTHTGVFIMAQQRGGVTVFAPGRDSPVFPDDELMLLGTREQLEAASRLLGEETGDRPEEEGFLMEQMFVAHDSPIAGESLAGIGVRRQYGVTVAGVQRGDVQNISPGPDFIVKSGDVLLVAGEVDSVMAFRKVVAGGLGPGD